MTAVDRPNRYMEKVMKFINRNAYIMIAVKGYSFCGGAARAIKLIVLNVGRLAAVNVIGDALIFLGKLTVVMACGALAFLMTGLPMFSKVDSNNYISSPLVPIILTLFAAYMVASVFFAVRRLLPQLHRAPVDVMLHSGCRRTLSPCVHAVLQVYEMAVDTILLSFCEDCTANNETPQFAPKLLMSALGKAKKFKEQQDASSKKKVEAADSGRTA